VDAYFGLVMLIGKYLFLGLLYAFLYWSFRGLFDRITEEVTPRASASPVAVSVAPPMAQPATVAGPVVVPPAAPAPQRAVAPAGPTVASLIVRDPGQSNLKAGQIVTLTAAVTIGRADDNGLVVQDKFCSQHHAMIFLQQGQRLLRDRNSTNGTFHNGQRLVQDIVLKHGDRITVGTATLEYRAAS
jgi:hypothetical protein